MKCPACGSTHIRKSLRNHICVACGRHIDVYGYSEAMKKKYGVGFRSIGRATAAVGKNLPDAYEPETATEVGDLDGLETFVAFKRTKSGFGRLLTTKAKRSVRSKPRAHRRDAGLPRSKSWFGEATKRLMAFRELKQDWDSYKSDPISQDAIDKAYDILSSLKKGTAAKPFMIVPLSDGGVQIEWRGKRGALEVEISSKKELSYLLVEGTEENRKFTEGQADLPKVQELVFYILGA